MAANMTGMRVEESLVVGTKKRFGQGRGQRFGVYGLAAAILVAMMIAGNALHDRRPSHLAATTIPRAGTNAETRYFGTTNLPNAIAAESAPAVVTSSQQRFLEANTTTLPGAVAASMAAPVTTRAQQRFWEANTMLAEGASYPYAEDQAPLPGQPR